MSEDIFEHIQRVPPTKLKRLSQSQIERLLTPPHVSVTTSAILMGMDLGVYRLPAGDLVIGFGEDSLIHDHDRWWFYSASPASRWVAVEADGSRNSLRLLPQMGDYLDQTAQAREQSQSGDFMVLQSLSARVALTKGELERGGIDDIVGRDVLLAARNPGALSKSYFRQRDVLSYREVHDLVHHPDVFKREHYITEDVPEMFLRTLYGLADVEGSRERVQA